MTTDINNTAAPRNNKAFVGLFLIALGSIYLLRQLDFFFFPSWLFSWPMILIIIGVASGIKHNFRNTWSYALIAIGGIFLLGHIINISLHFFWPLIIIVIGARMLMGRNYDWRNTHTNYRHNNQWHNNNMNQGNQVDL